MSKTLIVVGVIVFIVVVFGLWAMSGYNSLVSLDQDTQAQWAQVESSYQRRTDLIPNLVESVKGAAKFEKDTMIEVTEARAKVGQVTTTAGVNPAINPEALKKFQAAQDQLSSALSRMMIVVEKYPDLKATQNFRDLQSQLEGTENRISVERMRFNETAQSFNTKRDTFPTVVIAGILRNALSAQGVLHRTGRRGESTAS